MNSENNTTEDIDLEKKRDERCFPIAMNIFKELPLGLMVDDVKQKELQLKSLSAMLSADLNVSIEVSYVSQVILGVIAGLNATIQTCGLLNDEERYDSIAREILEIVAGEISNITLGKVTPEDVTRDFVGVKDKLISLFKRENLSQIEVKYVMDNVFTKYTVLNNAVQNSITDSTRRMESKILGIDDMSDLTLKKLNEELLK